MLKFRNTAWSGVSTAWRGLAAVALIGAIAAADTAALAGEGGGQVPNFKLKNLEGKNVELTSFTENGPVLLSFWATWCKPCLREMPHVDALREAYADQGLSVVAVSVDQSRSLAKVKSYVKTHGYGFDVLLDPNQRTLRKMKGSSVPFTVLVSPEGENLYTHSGYRDGDEKVLAELIAEVMDDYANRGGDADAAADGVDTADGEADARSIAADESTSEAAATTESAQGSE